jgi:hypothetical protein
MLELTSLHHSHPILSHPVCHKTCKSAPCITKCAESIWFQYTCTHVFLSSSSHRECACVSIWICHSSFLACVPVPVCVLFSLSSGSPTPAMRRRHTHESKKAGVCEYLRYAHFRTHDYSTIASTGTHATRCQRFLVVLAFVSPPSPHPLSCA